MKDLIYFCRQRVKAVASLQNTSFISLFSSNYARKNSLHSRLHQHQSFTWKSVLAKHSIALGIGPFEGCQPSKGLRCCVLQWSFYEAPQVSMKHHAERSVRQRDELPSLNLRKALLNGLLHNTKRMYC